FVDIIGDPAIQDVYCIIDGLDECTRTSQEVLLRAIEDDLTSNACGKGIPNRKVRTLITSRPSELAKEFGSKFGMIEIQGKDIAKDISAYVKHELEKTFPITEPSDDASTRRTISKVLDSESQQQKPPGLFLWASIALEE